MATTTAPDRRLSSKGLARKAALKDAALALFNERGFAATRVADIVQAAGVTPSLFYWYFEDKHDLVRELMADSRAALQVVLADVASGTDDVLERLSETTSAAVRYLVTSRPFFSFVEAQAASADGDPRVAEMTRATIDAHVEMTTRLITEGQAAGVIRDDDKPVLLAHHVSGLISYHLFAYAGGYVRASVNQLASSVARFVVRALAA